MPNNHVLLERIELTANAASVTFDNIPQSGYTDLKVVYSSRMSNSVNVVDDVVLSLNGSTSSFSMRRLFGSGTGRASDNGGANFNWIAQSPNASATANTYGNAEFYIPNYTSNAHKSISAESVSENNAANAYAFLGDLLWANTAAVSSITLAGYSSNFVAGSSFAIYGIAAVGTTPAIAPKADGGSIIATDGTYWYHAFLSNGTFKPQAALSCDVLVVAGGGGGAGYGGGGGAGGLLGFTSQSLAAAQSYACTVGAGGVKTSYNTANIGNGNNSQFGGLTAAIAGGGGGSATNFRAGNAGGSGGGSGSHNPGNGTIVGGSGTAGQGNAGGDGTSQTNAWGSGGGGGAAAPGTAGAGGSGGIGGNGSGAYSSWGLATGTGENVSSTYYFAGGGTGHAFNGITRGGFGGGGSGGINAPGTAGLANTGGGGGGWQGDGGNGGSGIVIVRYPVAS